MNVPLPPVPALVYTHLKSLLPDSQEFSNLLLQEFLFRYVIQCVTNTYQGMIWPKLLGAKDAPMTLRGGPEDIRHIQAFLKLIAPGLRAESIENAQREDIVLQGHGENISNGKDEDYSVRCMYTFTWIEASLILVSDITGDAKKDDGSLEYLTADAITDICHSGNLYRLQFRLLVLKDGTAFWCETKEWNDDNKLGWEHKINAPMIHIAGSYRWQQVYETKSTGGYLTHVCTFAAGIHGPGTNPLQIELRESVNRHLDKAKDHPRRPLDPWIAQVPQVRVYDGALAIICRALKPSLSLPDV
ncbi:hypothetical protein AG1IA_04837 [Rhizoctonia solani AG-1 IA]|uniref:Uncharacterized protein n=1 Tax=Thanatephorus cucumeris (strain AG1-IA) TaxID=983506 RepID=L8WXP1_THACA|nr:hypothetical protein AG1IA_04837 [Rhizoctonia solani AG-1 IA]